jgi:DNA-binding LacI/PurR family transcriptional regulator
MANIKQIAILAGVSTATVSHVLNDSAYVSQKLRARVMKVVRDLNYHPNTLARSLKTRISKTVGMVVTDITNAFYPAVVRGAEDVLAREGYTLIVGNTDGDEQKEETYYKTFIAKRVDGLLLITCPTEYPPAYLSRHNMEETPVVLINRDYPSLRADTVMADHQEGSSRAVSHLLESGHRRIGIVTGPAQHVSSRQRVRGYEQALRDRGLSVQPDLVREARFDIPSGYEQTKALLSLPDRPTALFVCNAPMTLAALRAILDMGLRCPSDIALVSFDDLEWFDLIQPRITAVAQPTYELGATAAELLLQRVSGQLAAPPCRKVLATELILRESAPRRFPDEVRRLEDSRTELDSSESNVG